jgi:hypothetical protein
MKFWKKYEDMMNSGKMRFNIWSWNPILYYLGFLIFLAGVVSVFVIHMLGGQKEDSK